MNDANPSATTATASREHHPIRWLEAFRALYDLMKDNDDTTHVFRIVGALRGNSDLRLVARMRESEIGRRILDERRSMLDVLSNREKLRALPEGSLGRVYLAFMEREGLTAEGLAQAADDGYGESRRTDPDVVTVSDWARDSHDLWHVLTGYGRDPLGELCLLGVLYSQIRSLGTGFIALLGLTHVPFEYPGAPCVRAVWQGFRIGRRAEWMIAQDWEHLLTLPIDDVRERLRLEWPTWYEQAVVRHDPSKSNSRAAKAKLSRSEPMQPAVGGM
jgi:ubiquinone biosynthesis protein COQ4